MKMISKQTKGMIYLITICLIIGTVLATIQEANHCYDGRTAEREVINYANCK